MKRFTDAGRSALESENWYAALSTALTLPDIASSLEDPGPGKSQRRFVDWCRKWLEPEFTFESGYPRESKIWFSAEDCYQARCSIIHSGSAIIDERRRKEIERFEFFSAGPHMNICGGSIDDVPQPVFLQLRVDAFCNTMFDVIDRWDLAVKSDQAVQKEKENLLVIRQPGVVINGIRFGQNATDEQPRDPESPLPS